MSEWVASCGYVSAEAFLVALRGKEEQAWRLVLGDWRGRLTRIYRRRADVEDIAGEAVRRFWQAISTREVRVDLDLRAYFLTIGVRYAIDLQRRRIPCGEMDPAILPWPGGHAGGAADAVDCNQIVWEAIQTLSDKERLVVLRRVVNEVAYDRIAQEGGMMAASCRVTYLRAIHKLREQLREWGVELVEGEPFRLAEGY